MKISTLIEEKYGLPKNKEHKIHYIDSNSNNKDFDNMFICVNEDEKLKLKKSFKKCIKDLINYGIIYFDENELLYKILKPHHLYK